VRLETRAMGCTWSVVLNPGPPRQVMCAGDAFQAVHDLEDRLTIYRAESELMALNRSALLEEWFPVSEPVFQLLQQCAELHRATEGAFDPVTRPLTTLWRECRRQGRIPAQDEVEWALSWCGLQHVEFDEQQMAIRFKLRGRGAPPLDIGFDLGAIGKGAGIDLAARHLQTEQIESFLVHGGYSSLSGRGQHGDCPGWPVGIRDPLFNNRRMATLIVRDCGLSTSGSNVQYFRHEGQRYGHILDPRTGWPCDNLLSVSVLAPTATLADALSTAFYVMGLDKSVRYCETHGSVAALLVPLPRGSRKLEPVLAQLAEELVFFET
jgi:thiamine biosynthesis lipoprotein